MADVSDMLGKTMVSVVRHPHDEEDVLYFTDTENNRWKMYHYQDCCESVYLEDVVGNLEDLVGSPLLMSELVSSTEEDLEYGEHCTWTFYKFATIKGYVTLRWYGTSNGYYSEGVEFEKIIAH